MIILDKIQNLIGKYRRLKAQFDNCQNSIDNTSLLENEDVLVYQTEWYGDIVLVADVENAMKLLKDLQVKATNGDKEYSYSEDGLHIDYKLLPYVDIEQLHVSIDTVQEPDPYEDYSNNVTSLSLRGDVPYTEKQQEEYKCGLKQKMAGIALDMHKVQEELLELGVDILGE